MNAKRRKFSLRPRRVHSPEYKLLTHHLKQARLQPRDGGKKLTQVELAKRLGQAQSYIYKVETAERELNVLELVDYCEALGVDVLEFLRKFLEEARQNRNSATFDESASINSG